MHNIIVLSTGQGEKTTVPKPQRPDNKYYVDILLPMREWKMPPYLLGAAVRRFTLAEYIHRPNAGNPLATMRLFRLTFSSVTAPREVFTDEDESVPIREMSLSCGATALIIQKWNSLNATPPPSLSKKEETAPKICRSHQQTHAHPRFGASTHTSAPQIHASAHRAPRRNSTRSYSETSPTGTTPTKATSGAHSTPLRATHHARHPREHSPVS